MIELVSKPRLNRGDILQIGADFISPGYLMIVQDRNVYKLVHLGYENEANITGFVPNDLLYNGEVVREWNSLPELQDALRNIQAKSVCGETHKLQIKFISRHDVSFRIIEDRLKDVVELW